MATWLYLTRIVMALSLFTAVGITPLSAAGRTNKSLANTILSGKSAPTTKLGINGDFYINTSTFQIYGPKVNNRWPAPISLIGPTGNAGSDGKQGDKGSSSSGATGSKGENGEKGDKGETGEKGEKGEKGEVGAVGAKGDTGTTGPTGATGATGAAGATGATGATGPSNVQVGEISYTSALVGNAGVSLASTNFATLEAGKSYLFDVLVWGKTSSSSLDLALAVSAMGQAPTITTHWISTNSRNYRGNTGQRELSFFGRVIINGSSTITNYQLAVTVSSGSTIVSFDQVTLGGGFSGQLVGSVTG